MSARGDGAPTARSRWTTSAGWRTSSSCSATIGALALGIDDNDRDGHRRRRVARAGPARASGMMLLAAARDLMIVFLGIELMSIAVYALAGSTGAASGRPRARSSTSCSARSRRRSCSTASRWSTAPPGTTNLHDDRRRASRSVGLADSPLLLVGIALLLVGFGFKVAAGAVPHVGARRLRGRADAVTRTWRRR